MSTAPPSLRAAPCHGAQLSRILVPDHVPQPQISSLTPLTPLNFQLSTLNLHTMRQSAAPKSLYDPLPLTRSYLASRPLGVGVTWLKCHVVVAQYQHARSRFCRSVPEERQSYTGS